VIGESIEILDRVVPEKPKDFLSKPPSLMSSLPLPSEDLLGKPPSPSGDFSDEKEPEKILVLLSDYIKLTKDDKKRCRSSLYNDLHSGKLSLPLRIVSKGNKKKYYFVEVTDPKVIEKVRSHEISKMTSMLFLKEGLFPSGNLGFSTPLTLVPHGDTPVLTLVPHGDTPVPSFKEESGITYEKEMVRGQEMKEVHLILSDYIKYFADKKSRRSIYRQVELGEFPLPVCIKKIRGRKYYFVEIADVEMIELINALKELKKEKSSHKENIIPVSIKVPEKMVKALNLISSPNCQDYKQLHKFIKEEVMMGKLNNVSTTLQLEPIRYEKKHIQMLEKDYQRLKQIASSSDLNISKTLTMLLEAYLMLNRPRNFLKGGQYGDMLSTC